MYASGLGAPKNYAEALKWFHLAADQESDNAQYNLGLMYGNGWGVGQDRVQAAKWYRLAADQGHAMAQVNLGAMYATGRGMRRDYIQAYMWFSLARADGLSNRDRVMRQMTTAQIAQGEKLVREWKPKRQINVSHLRSFN
jgi:TPR repeat protein